MQEDTDQNNSEYGHFSRSEHHDSNNIATKGAVTVKGCGEADRKGKEVMPE